MTLPSPTDMGRAGLYFLPAWQQPVLEAPARAAGFRVVHAYLGDCSDSTQALFALGDQLEFPDWYGANFDALYDCLTDPEWLPGPGHLIFVEGLAMLRLREPEAFATLIEVLQTASDERRTRERPFWLLIDQPAIDVAPLA